MRKYIIRFYVLSKCFVGSILLSDTFIDVSDFSNVFASSRAVPLSEGGELVSLCTLHARTVLSTLL